ncbi:TniQ protein [Amphibacillus marinus]|uniref:TniQ protein n=1 Tax=Amphibacillus marinus TaxID=872970 RepID=A0A1H8TIT1_9BACI|nr:TnsD family Tn7-like transposition protein [Amphibacillus marinus]SEO90464.1 TniQ protein [Amphibacillus marinus]
MLSFLPKLYPGELMYSWLARYHVQSGNTSFKQTNLDLFDSPSYISTADLPCQLNIFYNKSKHFSLPHPETLIREHTFYNYYSAFAPIHIKKKIMSSMLNGSHHALHMLIGHMASTIKENRFFRYCSSCFEENNLLYGEPYLHTIHQLPSCFICPSHKEILKETSILFRGQNKHEYKPLIGANCTPISVVKKVEDKTFLLLYALALESNILLQKNLQFDPVKIQKKYKWLLKENDLISTKGNIRQRLLHRDFLNTFNAETLTILQSHISQENESNWLRLITRKHRVNFHPVRHLLMIKFLGASITNLNKARNPLPPFGKGPFPCLNKAAVHYNEDVINHVSISYCSKTNKPIGTFSCECGFVYTRRGHDPKLHNKFVIGRIKKLGPVWADKLEELIRSKEYSYRAISKILSVDTNTVIKYSKNLHEQNKQQRSAAPIIIQDHRDIWINLQTQNPLKSKTELRKLEPNTFMWLYRNDKHWLDKHSPTQVIKKNNYSSKVDWNERDSTISNEIIPIIVGLMNCARPVRVTKSKIGKLINKLALLERHLDKMPLTNFILEDVTETVEEFQVRRVNFYYNKLINHRKSLSLWEIKKVAGLPSRIHLGSKLHKNLVRLGLLD